MACEDRIVATMNASREPRPGASGDVPLARDWDCLDRKAHIVGSALTEAVGQCDVEYRSGSAIRIKNFEIKAC